jgi:AmmeMemoRadiSam system protein B
VHPTKHATVRPAAVAGSFYPAEPGKLRAQIVHLLDDANRKLDEQKSTPRAWILPHAGYVYSGPVAASGYARIAALRGTIERVVVVGPAHRVFVRGIAASSASAWATPLGDLPVDRASVDRALELPGVVTHDAAHASEHSVEVHLPFLREVLGEVPIAPFVVGAASPEEVARLLEAIHRNDKTLLVISSDLSHYLAYPVARNLDAETAQAVERLDPDAIGEDQACGRRGIQGLLLLAKKRGLVPSTIDLRSSGDTAGPRDEVVGYGTFAFALPPAGVPRSGTPH